MKSLIKMYAIVVIALVSMFIISCSKDLQGDQSKLPSVAADTAVTIVDSIHPDAIIKAEVTSSGASQLTEQGICYDTMPNPTIAKNKIKSDSTIVGPFSVKINGLNPNTKYYVRAYGTSSAGTGYSNEVTFYSQPVKIGDEFKGGIVFYLDATGQHGLVSAKPGNDLSGAWGCPVDVPGLKTEIGSGQANTNAILAACGSASSAAKLTDESVWYGYKDWFMPSRDELAEMYKYRDLIRFNAATRWSSSQADANTAWAQSFDAAGSLTAVNKNTVLGVRPIRAF